MRDRARRRPKASAKAMVAIVSPSHDRQSPPASRPAMPSPHPTPLPPSSSRFPFLPVSYALRSSLIVISLFLICILLSLPLPSSSQSSHAATPISSSPLHRDSTAVDDSLETESPQAPLVPHLSSANATPVSPSLLMRTDGKGREVESGLGEEGAREVPGEGSFWLFELLVLIALIPSVIGLQRRKQYVMALHNRRLDRMVNS